MNSRQDIPQRQEDELLGPGSVAYRMSIILITRIILLALSLDGEQRQGEGQGFQRRSIHVVARTRLELMCGRK